VARYPFKLLSAGVTPLRVTSENAALLLIDPQRFLSLPEGRLAQAADERGLLHEFAEYYKQAAVAIDNMARLLESCRARSVRVLYTILTSEADDGQDLSDQVRSTGLPVPIGYTRNGIRQEVATADGEPILCRGTYSAFLGTDLFERLRSDTIDTILMGGLLADASVALTAREAADLGFQVVVVWDASASSTLAEHEHVKASLAGGSIRLRSTRETLALLRGEVS